MAFDFPSSPSDGQVFTPSGGPSYTYNAAGTKWLVSATPFTGQPLDALLSSIAALTFGADNYIYGTGSDTAAAGTVTSFMRTVLDDSTATAALGTLGVGYFSYTPTLFSTANLAATTANTTRYLVIDDMVLMAGKFDADPTTAGTLCQMGMSLPVASVLAGVVLGGVGASVLDPVRILSDAVNNRALLDWTPTGAGNIGYSFILMYKVT